MTGLEKMKEYYETHKPGFDEWLDSVKVGYQCPSTYGIDACCSDNQTCAGCWRKALKSEVEE